MSAWLIWANFTPVDGAGACASRPHGWKSPTTSNPSARQPIRSVLLMIPSLPGTLGTPEPYQIPLTVYHLPEDTGAHSGHLRSA